MTTIQKKVQKKVEEVNKLISLASNSESENAYEGNLMVVNSGSTWQEPMVYKPVKFTNGVLYIEYYEPYSHKTTKEKILSRDLELDGYGTLLDIAKMYRKALKSENITFAYGGSMEKSTLKIIPITTKRDSKGFRFYSDNTGNKLYAEKDNKIYNVNDDLKVIGEVPLQRVRFKFEGIVSDEDVKNLDPLYYESKTIERVTEQFKLKNKYKNGGSLIGNQKRIDLNKNGKIDVEDFKLLRSSMNGASRNERKHVNHNEDYEVRYAKKRPSRTGYKGKRDFAVGGKVDYKLTEKEVDKIAKETAKVLGSKFSVTKGSVDNGSFDLDYDGIEYDGGSYIVLENGDVKNVAVPESPIVYNHKTKMKYAFGGMFGGRTYSTGRAYTNDKKHVNHSEEHEVKYIKKHPNQKRHGYGGIKYNAGGSLENHGLKKGDRIIKTIDGGIQEVKDKDGNIVYVNLANGERSADIPLPFNNGGSLGTFSIEEFKKKQIASQREKEKGENFKKFKVNVYEQDKSGAYPFIDSLFTDNFAEAFNFAKIIIEKQRSYRGNSGVLWATIDKFTPIEDRMNVIYPYSEISRFTEEDLQKSKYDDGGEVKQKIESKNFSELKQGDVIRRKDSLGTTIFVVNSSAKQNRLYKNEYDLVATCIVSTDDFYKPFEEYSVKTIIKHGKLPNVDYLGKWDYDQKIDYSKYLPKSRNKYDDGGEVTYFVNKDGIRVRSVAKPDKELSEKEWMAKHSETNEARAYADGGDVKMVDGVMYEKVKFSNGIEDWYYTTDLHKVNFYCREHGLNPENQKDFEKAFSAVGKGKMLKGGKVTFKEKARAIARNFVGKRVEPKYQKEYGKTYDAKEAKEVGNKIAGTQKASYDAKAESGAVVKKKSGNPKMKEAMVLAKKIRKDGEKWTDAVKRAYAQIK